MAVVFIDKSLSEASSARAGRVSVHDPAILSVADENGEYTYYIFGSHLAQAKSYDLLNWEALFEVEYENPDSNPIYGKLTETFAESFLWAGYDDADCKGNYAIWAPDVIWNAQYEWKDGTKGAYMLYYSASSTWRRSCIGFLVSKDIEGIYEYGGTVVYSGFTAVDATDGSERNVNYVNTNIDELIEDGTLSGFSDNWVKTDGSVYNSNYAPNAIDPALFYDENGALWMVYGSWSGGIFLLEIDESTGMTIHPGEDSTTEDGRVIDRYFGTKLSGGYHKSGEGPYIVYDSTAGYYYLFETYGGLAANGGYNMRLFRSASVTGPYVDAQGNKPIFESDTNNADYGIKIMGNYSFDSLNYAYKAEGHNSAFIDENGQWYLVYHTRFDQGTEYHEVRVHQMFMNAEGWPVTVPYEYVGDSISESGYSQDEIIGQYQFINHGTGYGAAVSDTLGVSLNSDGTVTGDIEGTWKITSDYYMTMTIGGVNYSGIFYKQSDESDEGEKVMTFSATGENNETVWGSKVDYSDEQYVQMAADHLDIDTYTISDLKLPDGALFEVSINWSSSNEDLISGSGTVTRANTNQTVTLTATLIRNAAVLTKTFEVVVVGTWNYYEPIYYYDFESTDNGSSIENKGSKTENSDASLIGTAKVVTDEERGNVLEVSSQDAQVKTNYMALPTDIFDGIKGGYTIAMWVQTDRDFTYDTGHSALFEANAGGAGAYPMTRISANLFSRINSNGAWADAVNPKSALSADTWHFVSYTVGKEGLFVYLDGKLIDHVQADLEVCFAGNLLATMTDVRVGSGNIWNDVDISYGIFDNVAVYSNAYSDEEMEMLYLAQLITGYEEITGILGYAGEEITGIPSEISIGFSDGSTAIASAEWDITTVDADIPGSYIVSGVLPQYANYKVEAEIIILENKIENVILPVSRAEIYEGESLALPGTANAEYTSGTFKEVVVTWDSIEISAAGTYTVFGVVEGYDEVLSFEVIVKKKAEETQTKETKDSNTDAETTDTSNTETGSTDTEQTRVSDTTEIKTNIGKGSPVKTEDTASAKSALILMGLATVVVVFYRKKHIR